MSTDPTIEALFHESRTFPPPPEFSAHANAHDAAIYEHATKDLEAFWAHEADNYVWRKRWDEVLDWSGAPTSKWFVGGRLNITESCLDQHLATHGDRIAYNWEGEPGDRRVLTYRDLHAEVCRLANALVELGVGTGDRVAIYMGMVPELPVAMLACARLGATHSVVFGGYAAEALRDRINDAHAKVLITCDGAWRAGSIIPLKDWADEALQGAPSISKVLVVRRTGNDVTMKEGRDLWYHDVVPRQADHFDAVEVDAEHPLYILYSSGTTAKPKGVVHTTGGYLVGVGATHRLIFDLKPETDVFWCTADIGWVTGHSYIVYGPLANGATSVMYEGTPAYPDKDRMWALVERYKVSLFYTAPTALRTMIRWGDEFPNRHDLSSIRLLGTVGEPINPEAWMWYHDVIGKARVPIVDTWWQTETGMILITPLPGITSTKPGSATMPFPGVVADIVDNEGNPVPLGSAGYLTLNAPWPAMLRTLLDDQQRYVDVYWKRFSKPEEHKWVYFTGDGAKRDKDGYFWLLGRVDDVMNISGHRISTLEVESALVDHPAVAEAAVVGRTDARTGQAIAAFVSLKGDVVGDEALLQELRDHVAHKIGAIAKPASIVFTNELPKTRSGKIMRRLLRDVSEQRQLGDITALANADVVADIAERAKSVKAAED